MGNKPFTYHWTGSTLYFASEQQAILRQPEVPQVLNEGMVAEFLAAQWFSNSETLWQGILRLDAAHSMVVSPTGPTRNRLFGARPAGQPVVSAAMRNAPSAPAPCCSTWCVACRAPSPRSPAKSAAAWIRPRSLR